MIINDVNNLHTSNFKQVSSISKVNGFLDKDLNKAINNLKNQIKGMPEKGYFRNFAENYLNKDKNIVGKAISLSVERDEKHDGYARLIVALLHPNGKSDMSTMMIRGNKEDLLNYMEKESFSKELENAIINLSETMKKYV